MEVKTLYGSGRSGRSILCNYMMASDSYYRYWVGYHLEPSPQLMGVIIFAVEIPLRVREVPQEVRQSILRLNRKWTYGWKGGLLESAVMDEFLKYFNLGNKGLRLSKGGGFPWEDKLFRIDKVEGKETILRQSLLQLARRMRRSWKG